MRGVALVTMILLAGCGGTTTQTEAERLKDACDARECPDPPPDRIDCMPIIPAEWAPLCEEPCRSFLKDTCQIQYTF